MKRLLLTLLTTLSFLLLILTLTECIRSYYVVSEYGLGALKSPADNRITMFTAYTVRGKIYAMQDNLHFVDPALCPKTHADYFSANFWSIDFSLDKHPENFLFLVDVPIYAGFGYKHVPSFPLSLGAEKSSTQIFIPFYLPTLLFSLLPLHFLNRLRKSHTRKSRLAKSLCPTCSYDLRAHIPPSQSSSLSTQSLPPPRCPECGTPIPPRRP